MLMPDRELLMIHSQAFWLKTLQFSSGKSLKNYFKEKKKKTSSFFDFFS